MNSTVAFLLMMISFISKGQSYTGIELINTRNSKSKVISQGSKMIISAVGNRTLRGRLIKISDDSLYIKKKSIAINEIINIEKAPGGLYITGGFLVGAGVVITIPSLVLGAIFSSGLNAGTFTGLALITVGGVMTIRRTFNTKKWTIQPIEE